MHIDEKTEEIVGTDKLELEIENKTINEKDSDETRIKTNNKTKEEQKKATERKGSDDETKIKTIINENEYEDDDQENISGYEEDIKSNPPELRESKMMNINWTQREERTSDVYTKNLQDTRYKKHGSKFGKDQYMKIESE
jgi:hypothetical protein